MPLSSSCRNSIIQVFTRRFSLALLVFSCLGILSCLRSRLKPPNVEQARFSPIELYAYANGLIIDEIKDPICHLTKDTYVCAGYCPWLNVRNGNPVSCYFLPRIPHPFFTNNNIYCKPVEDHCPLYNAWRKDSLPLTLSHVTRIPDAILANFTLNNLIEVNYGVQEFRISNVLPKNWTKLFLDEYRSQVRKRIPFGNYNTSNIYPALDKYGEIAVTDKNCAVIGTEYPWVEAALLEYNPSLITTIEYSTIFSDVERIKTVKPDVFRDEQTRLGGQRQLFDSIWSYSSIEHDGLGRYQDPLNPYGDLQTMVKMTCILKPGGFMFLAVPLSSEDYIQFNLHRIYGPIRLPLLFRYFHVVELLGNVTSTHPHDYNEQPIIVLQNKLGCSQQ